MSATVTRKVGLNFLLYKYLLSSSCQATRNIMSWNPHFQAEKKLFTPGPLSVSMTTKEAMMHDLGSREKQFVDMVRRLRNEVVKLAEGTTDQYTCVPMQGSGTFSIEAVLLTTIPKNRGKVLILENGAYGKRQVKICKTLGIAYHHEAISEQKTVDATLVGEILKADPAFTHVSIVHSETSSGILNDIKAVGKVVKDVNAEVVYIVDGMSSFGGMKLDMEACNIDYLVSSGNKCLQGVPGFGFVVCRKEHLLSCKGNSSSLCLDIVDQYESLEANGQFRFTPPTHALLAFQQALIELHMEGGIQGRAKRYKANNLYLREGMKDLGFKEFLPPGVAGHIITTFLYPEHPKFDFHTFYMKLYEKGQVIYPGKLSSIDCFRLGNIGNLTTQDMHHLLYCIQTTCADMGIKLPLV